MCDRGSERWNKCRERLRRVVDGAIPMPIEEAMKPKAARKLWQPWYTPDPQHFTKASKPATTREMELITDNHHVSQLVVRKGQGHESKCMTLDLAENELVVR